MAILSMLCVSAPSGMWESIIKAFEGATNNYIWAIVLLTVVIRIVWAPFDTYNRRISAKNAAMQAKLQPELQKIQQKYGNDKQLLNQKTSELYKRNNYNIMGSCLFMLVFMALNLAIFFTLFSGLNNFASYKIYDNYENLKTNYANTLVLTKNNIEDYRNALDTLGEGQSLQFKVFTTEGENPEQHIKLCKISESGEEVLFESNYLSLEEIKNIDAPAQKNEAGEDNKDYADYLKNDTYLVNLINELSTNQNVLIPDDESTTDVDEKVTLLDKISDSALPLIADEYNATKESFAWIENIWIADSPFKTSIFSFDEFAGQAGRYIENRESEQTIYHSFMPGLTAKESRTNGYFILPIIIVVVSILSMWLSQWLMTGKNKQKGAKKQGLVMQIIMPIIMGIFAIFYNSVFAIYMLVSQIISTALLPLQQLVVKALEKRDEKKAAQKKDNNMDYRRKV